MVAAGTASETIPDGMTSNEAEVIRLSDALNDANTAHAETVAALKADISDLKEQLKRTTGALEQAERSNSNVQNVQVHILLALYQ